MVQSEVARIREQIRLEYEASKRIFDDFTPTARHKYITQRQANIEACFSQLQQYMTTDEAMIVLIQIEKQLHQSL